MRIKILGSAAGGGFPQWNCNCRNCSGLRSNKIKAKPRTQTQLAFTVDDKFWFLIHASPDLRTQILATPELAPPISAAHRLSNRRHLPAVSRCRRRRRPAAPSRIPAVLRLRHRVLATHPQERKPDLQCPRPRRPRGRMANASRPWTARLPPAPKIRVKLRPSSAPHFR